MPNIKIQISNQYQISNAKNFDIQLFDIDLEFVI